MYTASSGGVCTASSGVLHTAEIPMVSLDLVHPSEVSTGMGLMLLLFTVECTYDTPIYCTYVCLHAYTYVRTYMCTYVFCVSPHVHKYIVHACVYMYISNLTHVHIPTCVISCLQLSSRMPIGGVCREPHSNTETLLQAADHRQLRSGKVSLSHQTD